MSHPAAGELFDLHADGEPPADPFVLAGQWLPADDDPDRPRVTLATTGEDGSPNARTVLLSAFDESGFAFHTASTSRKVAELAADPRAGMVLLWPDHSRQLLVRGDVVPDGADQLAAAWAARSAYLRRLARCNTDELARLPLAERRAGWTATADQPPGQAASWVGYRLQPREITFWAAAPDTASRRLQYTRDGDGWRWSHRAG
ncbi:pyridoxamine 5'-phosphate oxidase family protein [Modestobacter sp. VKM Ac-2985]|uniref:pyridoxamine 5'-phosphate oxidase family protein n=1 Tax=Modestobacter sp. VKM Ac-2985 TaxID=3004139 RepID=UPI0022ABBE20|nr:pyridoxamine 5'-phosphate oxidase family protein [Modestobacter sp. VKM Ac-2985]MCZ2839243.1 pyridoxamine 5'-phosphate oxidase family protein [Modestobacter sp. VKM Ac-2985]